MINFLFCFFFCFFFFFLLWQVSPPAVDASPNATGQTKPLQDKKDGTPPHPPPVPSPSETLQPSSILVVKGANDKRSPDLERAKISSNEESKRPRSADDGRMRKG